MIALETPLALLIAVPLGYLWWRLGRGPRQVWPIRAAVLVLTAVILASPVLRARGLGRHVVFLVDKSLSAGAESAKAAAEMLALAAQKKGPEDRVSVVVFGDGAAVLPGAADLPSQLKPSALDDASDLHAGLALANALCAAGAGDRVLLVSDGFYTGPDPMEVTPELRKKDVAVHFWAIEKAEKNDAAITRIELPERVSVGHPFEVTLSVRSPKACEATVRVEADGPALEQKVTLRAGDNRLAFRHALPRAGLARYVVTASVPDDDRPENNRAVAVTEAVGPGEVLVVNSTGQADNLSRALTASGFSVRVSGPGLAVSSGGLKPFSAVVLQNVALSSLSDRADAALRNFVTEMGGGLFVTGGENSFANGGYYQSRLEPVLPVSMERRDEYRRPQVAMAIVIDRSGSMSITAGGGKQKIDLANRAAVEAISLLTEQDEASVIAVDSEAHVVVPLTRVGGSLATIRRRTLSIESMGGGIFIYVGLQAAVGELMKSKAPTRHIVLFADAADSEEPGDYKKLVGAWAKAGHTLSVVGLGTEHDCDAELLKDIARLGRSRAFFTNDPHSLPRIFCEDTMRIARKTFLKEKTAARVNAAIAEFGPLGISRFPAVLGYNLCYQRPEAAEAVTTADGNKAPLLSMWQRGLGRVVALTCEADGSYSGDLGTWPDYKPLVSAVVKWMQKTRDDPAFFGSVVREGRTATVVLEMTEAAARGCTGATALIISPDESAAVPLPLQWTSPQSMQASFPLRRNGIYHGVIVTRERSRVSLPAVTLPYSPEFEPKPPGSGVETLKRIAAATGGDRLLHVQELFTRRGAVSGRERTGARSLAPPLAALVIGLVMADIITRRALWPRLIPGRARRAWSAASDGVVAASRFVRRRIARLSARRIREEEAAPRAEEKPSVAPGGTPAESIFDKAKRRSRR